MTIGIGILCSDGLVVGSDSQVGIAGGLKWSTQKIFTVQTYVGPGDRPVANGAMAITGAGDAHYLGELHEVISEVFKPTDTPGEVKKKVKSRFRSLYRHTVLPFAGTYGAPELHMLCGVQKDGSSELYTASKMSFKSNLPYAAVGSGEFVARAIIESIFPTLPSVESATMLVIYALMHVRDRVDSVGGKSEVVSIKNNTVSIIDGSAIAGAEREFRRYEMVQSGILRYIVGNTSGPGLKAIGTEANGIRCALQACLNPAT